MLLSPSSKNLPSPFGNSVSYECLLFRRFYAGYSAPEREPMQDSNSLPTSRAMRCSRSGATVQWGSHTFDINSSRPFGRYLCSPFPDDERTGSCLAPWEPWRYERNAPPTRHFHFGESTSCTLERQCAAKQDEDRSLGEPDRRRAPFSAFLTIAAHLKRNSPQTVEILSRLVEPFGRLCPRATTATQRRRNASHPASLAVQPAHRVRSFERIRSHPVGFPDLERSRSSAATASSSNAR